MAPFSGSGNVGSPQLITVVSNVVARRLEGIMRIELGKFKKELYFKNGLLVGGRSNILRETFGRVLFENGFINQHDYEDSLKEVMDERKKHGLVLQERGLLPLNIKDALKLQLRMRFVYTFSMAEGNFHFREAHIPDNLVSQSSLPVLGLVMEGVKVHLPKNTVSEYVNRNMDRVCSRGDTQYDPSQINLSQEELNLLTIVASNRPLKQSLSGIRMDADGAMRLVFLFIGMGFAVLKDLQKAEKPEKTEVRLSEEHRRLLEGLKDKFDEIKEKNYYEVLNISQSADRAAVKRSYFALAKQYHPDHFFDYPPEIKEAASEIFTLVTTAYGALSDDGERGKYNEYLKTGEKEMENSEAEHIVKAELQFQKGMILLKTNNLKDAYQSLKWAVELNPTEGEYLSYFGWVIFKLEPNSDSARAKGMEYIQRGLQLNKEQDTGYYFLGRILKVTGEEQKALDAFKTAYAKNQQNIDALREIRAYELSQKSQKGMFKKFFK
ncbi:MAG: DnaJ domain-containing protein [Deltaproteobacteria bacterium]|nr:DnaJ domain-containing protein [Deltaproteobacteria bacterium]MCL5278142.1 DnaJ domain-containing protein [Deltaproteobacteria bacterium]